MPCIYIYIYMWQWWHEYCGTRNISTKLENHGCDGIIVNHIFTYQKFKIGKWYKHCVKCVTMQNNSRFRSLARHKANLLCFCCVSCPWNVSGGAESGSNAGVAVAPVSRESVKAKSKASKKADWNYDRILVCPLAVVSSVVLQRSCLYRRRYMNAQQ